MMDGHVNVQRLLADALVSSLDGTRWTVHPYPWGPGTAEPGRRYISVYRTDVDKTVPGSSEVLPDGAHGHSLNVDIYSSHSDMERAEDDLQEGTDEVLSVIDHDTSLAGFTWSTATRTVLGTDDDAFHAMRVSVWGITTEIREQEQG